MSNQFTKIKIKQQNGYSADIPIGTDAIYVKYNDSNVADALYQLESNTLSLTNNTAGFHNAHYRGQNLGNELTEEQIIEITNGTFNNLFIGDYWLINDVHWRIAAFDYFLYTGDSDNNIVTKHHIVIVPDEILGKAKMNLTAVNNNGYIGTNMHLSIIPNIILPIIKESFDENNILSYKQALTAAVDNSGKVTTLAWDTVKVTLLTMPMLFGSALNYIDSSSLSVGNTQLPLFRHAPSFISVVGEQYWIKEPKSTDSFLTIKRGSGYKTVSDEAMGIRPMFAICGSEL